MTTILSSTRCRATGTTSRRVIWRRQWHHRLGFLYVANEEEKGSNILFNWSRMAKTFVQTFPQKTRVWFLEYKVHQIYAMDGGPVHVTESDLQAAHLLLPHWVIGLSGKTFQNISFPDLMARHNVTSPIHTLTVSRQLGELLVKSVDGPLNSILLVQRAGSSKHLFVS